MKRMLLLSVILVACSADAAGPDIDSAGFIGVGAGGEHTCAAITRGTIYCFGSDQSSQLGNRAKSDNPLPVAAESNAAFVSLSSGAQHTCALDSSGQLYCWGNNNYGQLGNGTTVTLDVPVILVSSLRFTSATAGGYHSCALTGAGEAYCWGAGGQGQLGTGQSRSSLIPVRVAGSVRFALLTAGAYHTCGLALDGRAYCWGQNDYGQLGANHLDNTNLPVAVADGFNYRSISAGATHSCGITTNGQGYCWGSSLYGELGTTFTQPSGPGTLKPSPVFGGHTFTSISAGSNFTCAIRVDGGPMCWGRGVEGQIGNGHVRNWATPQTVSDGQFKAGPFLFSAISAGRTHACGVTTSGALYCWGRGESGQLGSSVTAFSPLAIRVPTQ
jgi:alpha-tubulin suppressor-like RCC1 family protein